MATKGRAMEERLKSTQVDAREQLRVGDSRVQCYLLVGPWKSRAIVASPRHATLLYPYGNLSLHSELCLFTRITASGSLRISEETTSASVNGVQHKSMLKMVGDTVLSKDDAHSELWKNATSISRASAAMESRSRWKMTLYRFSLTYFISERRIQLSDAL